MYIPLPTIKLRVEKTVSSDKMNKLTRKVIRVLAYTIRQILIIIIIITYIYNALNDALSASRIHNKLKTILSKYIHIQNRQS